MDNNKISRITSEISKIENFKIEICFSSPLSRALETAKILCDKKCKIIIDERLAERNYGKLEGKPINDNQLFEFWNLKTNSTPYGVESLKDLLMRANDFIDHLKTQPYDEVLVVCHGALLKAIYYNIVGYDENTGFLSWQLHNCEVFSCNLT